MMTMQSNLKNLLLRDVRVGKSYYAEQETWLADTIADIEPGLKILDAGAGELRNKKFCEHLCYTSLDKCEYSGGELNKLLETGTWDTSRVDIVADLTEMPIVSNSFDVVLCTEVFEHIPDPIAAIREFHRVLKKGGRLVITAPFASLTHFSPFHFTSGFNKFWYMHHLPALGFEIVKINTNGNYFEYMGLECFRINSVARDYARNLSLADKLITYLFLKMLDRLSTSDRGSDELLCFGYHVLARKL
jgi:ubiquinone/menaquinone biosynthesis C-methylase UbiE